MNIIDIKRVLHDERILAVVAHAQFMPTPEKLHALAHKCQSDAAVAAFGCEDNGLICGTIILRDDGGGLFEIMSIATIPAYRTRGVASRLIAFASDALNCATLRAETDDDAVGFYRKCGFQIESLGEKYPGIVRYLCTLSRK